LGAHSLAVCVLFVLLIISPPERGTARSVKTTFRLLGPNDKIVADGFDDPNERRNLFFKTLHAVRFSTEIATFWIMLPTAIALSKAAKQTASASPSELSAGRCKIGAPRPNRDGVPRNGRHGRLESLDRKSPRGGSRHGRTARQDRRFRRLFERIRGHHAGSPATKSLIGDNVPSVNS
jgi:hypothetical protein